MNEEDKQIIQNSINTVQKLLDAKYNDRKFKIKILSKEKLKLIFIDKNHNYSTVITRDNVLNFRIGFSNNVKFGEIKGNFFVVGQIYKDCFETFIKIDSEIEKEDKQKVFKY